jgi:hypothetical protein
MAVRATEEWRQNVSNAMQQRAVLDRAARAAAIKADIDAGTFARRIDRLVEEDDGSLGRVFRILSFDPEE